MAISALTSADIFPVNGAVRIDFTQVDSAPAFAVDGTFVETSKGPAIYALVGAGGVIAGSYVALTQNVTTEVVTATEETTTSSGATPRKGAIAVSAASAGQYTWFLTGPFDRVPVDVANSISSGANVTTTATAGQLGAGGDAVVGLYVIEASGASGLTASSAIQSIGTNI